MNPLRGEIPKATFGELLVQIRLLQYKVQAVFPLKDTGNDLIAVRGKEFRAIQVKTTGGDVARTNKLPELYDILALVFLNVDTIDENLKLDECRIFLVPKDSVIKSRYKADELYGYEICENQINDLFGDTTLT